MSTPIPVLYFYNSHQFDTGSPKSLAALVETLDRSRYEPLFWATGDGPLVTELQRRDVRIVRGAARSLNRRRPLQALRAVAEKARRLRQLGVGLLHVNDWGWNDDLVVGAAVARIPIVLHARTPISIARGNLNVHLSRRIIYNSNALRDSVPLGERARQKSAVLYPRIDLRTYRSGSSCRRRLGIPDSDVVVGTIGQLSIRKGIDTVLEAARRLLGRHTDVSFLVVGRAAVGEESYAEKMIAAGAADPRLRGRVHFLGSRTDVPDLLASMDILFHPARAEPFGRVLVEAMAAGLPVVASAVDGITEIIPTADIGCLAAPGEVERFADALSDLIVNREYRLALGRRGHESLAGRFDAETYRRRLHGIYAGLHLSDGGGRHHRVLTPHRVESSAFVNGHRPGGSR